LTAQLTAPYSQQNLELLCEEAAPSERHLELETKFGLKSRMGKTGYGSLYEGQWVRKI
jgi:hypothetical protein